MGQTLTDTESSINAAKYYYMATPIYKWIWGFVNQIQFNRMSYWVDKIYWILLIIIDMAFT